MSRNGITLVEVFVVLIVVGAMLAILLPILRERDHRRLQALANAEPSEVFEFRAEPAKETFAKGDRIVIRCEIVNPTRYQLKIPINVDTFYLVFEGKREIISSYRYGDGLLHKTAVGPGESGRFDVRFNPGTVAGMFQIMYGTMGSTDATGNRFSKKAYFESTAFQLVVQEAADE